jgi:endonuclease
MKTIDFENWMLRTGNEPGPTRSRISNLRRVEVEYGDLDTVYEKDKFASLLSGLAYTKDDERAGKPNPSPFIIDGNIYNGLATLRAALSLYRRFCDEAPETPLEPPEQQDFTFSLERDLQKALRTSIARLEEGLTIIDGGKERNVQSGRIDILARDPSGVQVVIELKAVCATRGAVGQVLSYMGDIHDDGHSQVRGIIVAPSFDGGAISAARMVSNLKLVTYAYSFAFTPQSLSARAA